MSCVKFDTRHWNSKEYNLYQVKDYTSPDHQIDMSVAFGIPFENNYLEYLEYLDEKLIKPFVTDLMSKMEKYNKVMVIVDISQFPIIAVSFAHERYDLINDGTDIGVNMNRLYDEFTWKNKRFPLIFINLNITHTGLCLFDYETGKFVKN